MKQVVETSEIKRKIEKLINSANKDFKKGLYEVYDLKNFTATLMFSYLEDLVCEPETWEDDMFRLNEWFDSVRR